VAICGNRFHPISTFPLCLLCNEPGALLFLGSGRAKLSLASGLERGRKLSHVHRTHSTKGTTFSPRGLALVLSHQVRSWTAAAGIVLKGKSMRNDESDPAAKLIAEFRELDNERWFRETKHLLRTLHEIFEEKTKHIEHPWTLPAESFIGDSGTVQKRDELVEIFGELDDQEWLDEIRILLRGVHVILDEKTQRLAQHESVANSRPKCRNERQSAGFTAAERRAIKWFGAKYSNQAASEKELARWILQHVLANPRLVCSAIDAFFRYRNAEGFVGRGNELADARIAQCAEYR
jgi:hypothetical protein